MGCKWNGPGPTLATAMQGHARAKGLGLSTVPAAGSPSIGAAVAWRGALNGAPLRALHKCLPAGSPHWHSIAMLLLILMLMSLANEDFALAGAGRPNLESPAQVLWLPWRGTVWQCPGTV